MAAIKGKNTKAEVTVRRLCHSMGYRFRLHRADLPGTPDIVLPRWNAVIRVNGCFFHGHDCPAFRLPSSNPGFWRDKISQNRRRDTLTAAALTLSGWRVATVWECALRGPRKLPHDLLAAALSAFIKGDDTAADWQGQPVNPSLNTNA